MNVIGKEFFQDDTLKVAEKLLGKYLVRKDKESGRTVKFIINEVEAYDGPQDLACHASKGFTERTKIMFGPAGYFYIYLCYGIHWMLNIVTGNEGYPAAILIRGGILVDNKGNVAGIISGPAKLTKYAKIDNKLNKKLACVNSGLWFEESEIQIKDGELLKTPRIGVAYAGPIWSKKKYRFLLPDCLL